MKHVYFAAAICSFWLCSPSQSLYSSIWPTISGKIPSCQEPCQLVMWCSPIAGGINAGSCSPDHPNMSLHRGRKRPSWTMLVPGRRRRDERPREVPADKGRNGEHYHIRGDSGALREQERATCRMCIAVSGGHHLRTKTPLARQAPSSDKHLESFDRRPLWNGILVRGSSLPAPCTCLCQYTSSVRAGVGPPPSLSKRAPLRDIGIDGCVYRLSSSRVHLGLSVRSRRPIV